MICLTVRTFHGSSGCQHHHFSIFLWYNRFPYLIFHKQRPHLRKYIFWRFFHKAWNHTECFFNILNCFLVTHMRSELMYPIKRIAEYGIWLFLQIQTINSTSILWIEKFLQTLLDDYRKYVVWRILSPYLINIRKCSVEEAMT